MNLQATHNFGVDYNNDYFVGTTIKNSFEADGDLLKVESQRAGTTLMKPYVSNFSYTAAGGISQMRLGNGRWETAKFNDRLQVTELGLGASATDASVWKVAYGYGELDANGNVDQTKNTGNIAKQTISFNGLAQPFVQTFRYDSLYRITEAKEANGTATIANWQQNWSYDRYGNRLAFAQNINGVTNNLTPSIDTNTNRFTSGQGFVYDKNGNITADVDYNETRSFTFNGDNKQTEILKNGNVIGRYFYDGEGKRVKKVTDQETTIFVYSGGKLVAEYSTKLADNPTVNYTTTDHLGSPRVITDQYGQVKSRRDFMPFGEDLAPDTNNRTAALKYNTDEVRQKFTGYQKDNETGLDFAEARMYNNQHGRFTAVDPLIASGKSANPQTFNRYVYVGNNPILRTDPNGMDWYIKFGRRKAYIEPVWYDDDTAARSRGARKWGTSGTVTYGKKTYNYTTDFVLQDSSTGMFQALDPFSGDKSSHEDFESAKSAYQNFVLRAAKNGGMGALDNVSLTFWAARKLAGIEANENHSTYQIGSRFGAAFGIVAAVAGGGAGVFAKLTEKTGAKLFGSLAKIYGKFPAADQLCTKSAQQALKAFEKAGLEGEIVQISSGAPYVMTKDGTIIGERFHQAVQVGDRYFDSITQEAGMLGGATWDEYIKLFEPGVNGIRKVTRTQ